MAKRNHNIRQEDFDYGDYGDEYNQELDDEELAIKLSKQLKKEEEKKKKQQKGIQESDIDEVIKMINSKDAFTRAQIRGTLENFKGDKVQTKE